MIRFRRLQAERLNNVKLGGDRGGHTWGKDWSYHWRNTGWCKVSSIHCSLGRDSGRGSASSKYQQYVEIATRDGNDTRFLARLVSLAKKFEADVKIIAHGISADGKRFFKLSTLNLEKGTVMTIQATGTDGQEVVDELVHFVVDWCGFF